MALVLREADVQSLLTMPDAVRLVEDAMRAHAEGRARNTPRHRVKLPNGTLHVLPAADLDQGVVGLKSYTTFRQGARFVVLLHSAEDGRLLALLEADYLGMMRTGATSGVATRYMARQDADVLALFGSGWQARGQLEAVSVVRPLRKVKVYGRDPERRQRFATETADRLGLEVVPAASPSEALEDASIVTTVTSAREPVFQADAILPGVHVNAVGSNSLLRQEIPEELVRKAALVVVDSRVQAQKEAGDLLIPAERGWLDWDQLPELSDVVAGRIAGRRAETDITLFESQGLGLEDVSVAAHVYRLARERGVGEELKLLE
jgi:alanine dehydrogenase